MEPITWAINTVWHLIFSRAWLQLKHLWLLILYCLLELQLIIVFISLPIMLFCPMHSPKTWIYLIYFHSSGRRAACIYIWGAHIWRLCSSSLFESQFYHRPGFVFFILCICFVPPPPSFLFFICLSEHAILFSGNRKHWIWGKVFFYFWYFWVASIVRFWRVVF